MPIVSCVATVVFTLAASFAAAWWLRGREDRRARASLAADMLGKVGDRYDAYVELEDRIGRAIKAFDHHEAEFERQMQLEHEQVRTLEQMLESRDAFDPSERNAVESLENALGVFIEDVAGPRAPLPSSPDRELTEELDYLQRELASFQEQRRLEVERQKTVMEELSASIARIEEASGQEVVMNGWGEPTGSVATPTSTAEMDEIAERLQSLDNLGTLLQERQDELESLRAAYRVSEETKFIEVERLSQQLASAQARLAEREPTGVETTNEAGQQSAALEIYAEQLTTAQERIADLEERCREAESANMLSSEEMALLRGRAAELEPYVSMHASARNRVETLEAQVAAMDGMTSLELEEQSEEVERLQTRLAQLLPMEDELVAARRRIEVLEERARQSHEAALRSQERGDEVAKALRARVAELEPMAEELASARARIVSLEKRCERIQSQKRAEIEVLMAHVEELRASEVDSTAREKEFRERVRENKALEERCAALERSKKRALTNARRLREELCESEEMIHELGRDPAEVREERNTHRAWLRECMKELDELTADVEQGDLQFEELQEHFEGVVSEQDDEIQMLAAKVSALYAACETVDELLRQLPRTR